MTHPQQPAEPLYCPPCAPGQVERSATIDLDALEHNVRRLKELLGDRVLIAVIKADAYTGERAIAHLKADTGLGRNGATAADWPALVARAASLEESGLITVEGIFSHLAVADEPTRAETAQQVDTLDTFVAQAREAGLNPKMVHLANSPATLTASLEGWDTEARLLGDGVRCGLALYGLSPLPEVTAEELGLKPVMTVGSYIAAVKEVPAGQGVSYGLRYHTPKATTLALVPLGYADGVARRTHRMHGTRRTAPRLTTRRVRPTAWLAASPWTRWSLTWANPA